MASISKRHCHRVEPPISAPPVGPHLSPDKAAVACQTERPFVSISEIKCGIQNSGSNEDELTRAAVSVGEETEKLCQSLSPDIHVVNLGLQLSL